MSNHADPAVTKTGDLVLLDYELWAEGAGRSELVDTTREEVAQAAKIPVPEGHTFGPRPHLLGGDYFPGGIENALVGQKVGAEWEREFAPADAFGERDPKLIELFSMHEVSRLPEMRRDDAHLDIGTVLTIDGRRGRVVSLTAARVRVDFNPAYAGRKVRAKFKVLSTISQPVAQAKALIDLTYGHGDDFKVDLHEGVLSLQVPDRSKFDFGWAAAKPRVIDQLRTHLKPSAIKVVEEYVTPKETPKESPKESAPSTPSPSEGKSAEKAHGTEPKAAASGHGHTHEPSRAKPSSEKD